MEEKWSKAIIHASAFFAPFLVPFIFFLVGTQEVKKTAIQALLFQVFMVVMIGISVLLMFVLIGVPMVIVFGLMSVIIPIVGTIKALQGEEWNYPVVKRWV